ncbi:hypothetical protein RN001_006840 [Aquatica leii]|uniref:Protein phosphatase 1 regulatory subunit 36 n=1 Tax=Aquatica leii TaxID=1421715 RepID=A0AAN7PLJ3_9COLE|nr:hypothetical protein RN001_006840 [Aquatica leii]
MESGRPGNFRNGYWMWDEVTNGLLFVSRDISPRMPSQTNISAIISGAVKKPTKEMRFRETVDHLDQARFRRHHQRRCKPNEPDVITIQDIKDIAIYLANPKNLSLDFIKYFHTPTMDRFLRSLIVYFQFYIQVWEIVLSRREEAKHKLYQPCTTIVENGIRDDLADLRVVVSREYSSILVGAEDARKYHHMLSNKNNVSLSDKDRKMFETLICMCARVVWIALQRKNFNLIEREMNKMLRTDLFNSVAHREQIGAKVRVDPGESRILWGQSNTYEKKLLHRSLIAKEMVLGKHDYRLLLIGLKQFQPVDERMKYLEIAFSAPEELLLRNRVLVGMLGLPRGDYDAMLMNLTQSAKKRLTAKPRILPEFKIPPPVIHSDNKMAKEFPKQPSKFKETQQKIKSRSKQLKMWRRVLEKGTENRDMSLDLTGTQSQALLSSRSSISMATKRSVQLQE